MIEQFPLFVTSLCGLLIALFYLYSFLTISSDRSNPFAIYGGVLTVASLIVVGSLLETTLIYKTLFLFLLFKILQCRKFRKGKWELTTKPEKRLLFIIGIILSIDLLYACFPAFRFDQWSYHLGVSKHVSSLGTLPKVMINDHLYFAGAFEYLMVIPRIFFQNDVLIQSVSNSFCWLLFVSMTFATVRYFLQRQNIESLLLPSAFTFFALLALPDHASIISTKPDFQLFVLATMVLSLHIMARTNKQTHYFWHGFLIFAPIVFKITWIHFLLAYLPIFSITIFCHLDKIEKKVFLQGAVLGLIVASPNVIKNWYYFSNPVYPAASSFFQTTGVGPIFFEYWERIGRKTPGVYGFIVAWQAIGVKLISKSLVFASALFVLVVYKISKKQTFSSPGFWDSLWILIAYILIWPFFYGGHMPDRFVSPFYALLFVILIVLIVSISNIKERLTAVSTGLVLFGISSSEVEVRSKLVLKNALKTPYEFYSSLSPTLQAPNYSTVVNRHRAVKYPKSAAAEAILLGEISEGYFFDSLHIFAQPYNLERLSIQYGTSFSQCPWNFVYAYKVNYLFVGRDNSFMNDQLRSLIKFAEPLDVHRSIFHLPESIKIQNKALENCI